LLPAAKQAAGKDLKSLRSPKLHDHSIATTTGRLAGMVDIHAAPWPENVLGTHDK
jgi:hypothetical protein